VPVVRVLYVEDDLENREVTAALLAHAGFDVAVAATASEAEALLDQVSLASRPHATADGGNRASPGDQPFDIVLADLSLPDRDGWYVARCVKQRFPKTPVVLLTGWNIGAGDQRRTLADAVLSKPVAPDALARQLNALALAPVHA
jgi:CheY-like chemotaxis protein